MIAVTTLVLLSLALAASAVVRYADGVLAAATSTEVPPPRGTGKVLASLGRRWPEGPLNLVISDIYEGRGETGEREGAGTTQAQVRREEER